MASIRTGRLSSRHIRLASSVAIKAAKTSFPSILMEGMPRAGPLAAEGQTKKRQKPNQKSKTGLKYRFRRLCIVRELGSKSRNHCFDCFSDKNTKINPKLRPKLQKHYQKKMTGASRVAAKLRAACASPSEAAPSPK